jgi:patatin-related protein
MTNPELSTRDDLRQQGQRAATDGAPTQLRLALVCYGGVSLAIYMHGVTKELHRLVSASRVFDETGPAGENPFDQKEDSRHAYFEVLRTLATSGRPVSVSVDIVAGTSAGGINGVCLAKVLARNGSQEALKRLWIDEGDLKKLLRYARFGGWRARAAVAVGWTVLGGNKARSPLRGDRMSQLIYDAIRQMDAPVEPARPSLLLPDSSLDLFVTTTDLDGFPILVGTGAGGASQRETNNAQIVEFHSTDDAFDATATGALAFSARATSSFPGAFPPVSLASFQQELGQRPFEAASVAKRFRNRYTAGTRTSDNAWFVDGGVLDNAPFDLVVEAIGSKRAQSEVVRHLIYIEPDPASPLAAIREADAPQAHAAPGYFPALLKGVLTVKGSHSMLRDLQWLRDTNIRIIEIGSIADLQMEQVTSVIKDAWSRASEVPAVNRPASPWDINVEADVKALADSLYSSTRAFIGAGYPTYCRLKVDEAGRRLADEIAHRYTYPPNSSRSSFVRIAVSAWAREQVEWTDPDPTRLMEMLGPVDVPYRERRLLFILAGINRLYPETGKPDAPTRGALDDLKSVAWTLLEELRGAPTQVVQDLSNAGHLEFLSTQVTDDTVLEDPYAFAGEHAAQFNALFKAYREALAEKLRDHSIPMWRAFKEHSAGWGDSYRQELLSRYIGFPLWDSLIFPTVALGRLPQFTPIGVTQFSPIAARALPTPKGGKLKGVTLHHFGGFIDASWRENDYLWGRLDAAELILRTLRQTDQPSSAQANLTPAAAITQAGDELKPALNAIMASENDLRRIPTTDRDFIRTAINALPN